MKSSNRHDANQSPGWALVSVLWVVTILAAMALSVQTLTIHSAQMERRAAEQVQMEALIDAAVARTALGLNDPRIRQRWRVDGEINRFLFFGNDMTVRVEDELGKIDINVADGSMISRLLQAAGLPEGDAATLTSRILEWRSRSGVSNTTTATDADYAAAGMHYRIRHGPFRSIDELCLVLGVTPQLFEKIRPALTVYTNKIAFDPANAPEMALRALYLNQPDKVADILNRRKENTPSDTLGTRGGVLAADTALAGRAFSVIVEMSITGHRYRRRAVIEMTGDPNKPYFFLAFE